MTTDRPYDFDVAISFAGEDRAIVREAADALKTQGVRTFFDEDFAIEMWGEDLIEYFDAIYGKQAQFMLMFISRNYAEKAWPRLERRAGLERALTSSEPYILPVRLDDSEFPDGLPGSTGFLDARRSGVDGIAKAVLLKIGGRSVWEGTTPRSQAAIDQVLALRPRGWEYFVWAGYLYLETERIADKFLDQEVSYAPPSGERVSGNRAAWERAQQEFAEAEKIITRVMPMWERATVERAFGKPGEPGDPGRIEHLARRMAALGEDLLDWSSRVRALGVPRDYEELFSLLARTADQPIAEYRTFVDDAVRQMDQLPELLARDENTIVKVTLTLTLDQALIDEYLAEAQRLAARGLIS